MNYEENLLKHLVDLSNFMIEQAKKNNIPYTLFPNISYVYEKLNIRIP